MARFHFSTPFIALLLASTSAYANDAVNVRASAKDDYTRIVFEWPKAPSYVTDKTASSLTLKFQSAADFKTEGAGPDTLPRVTSYKTPDAKTAVIGISEGQDISHFEIGNKIIVDIRGPVKDKPSSNSASAVDNQRPEEKKPAEKVISSEIKKVDPVAVAKVEAVTPPPAPAQVALDQNSSHEPLIIGISSTSPVGIAAFKRFGNLWIVIDAPDFPIAPQLFGAQAKTLGSFERVTLKEATAFRIAVPDKLKFYVEGQGLVWKIMADGKSSEVPATDFLRRKLVDKTNLIWPVPSARRVVELNDPIVGDTLKVVTVDAAKYYAGAPHSYSQFQSLESFAGLALETKIDTLKVSKDKDGVLITSDAGLAVSPESDFIAVKPQAATAVATTPSSPDQTAAVQPIPATPAIFHFNEWLMGGEKAVDENKRILMSGLGAKSDPEKATDLLMLGKMELAHGRGPEASGYFDLAAQYLPDLTTSPEFLALHGASDALAGQYEPALKSFSNDSLKSTPDINIWKAYTLAGLEDWEQSGNVLPSDFSSLAKYPEAVKTPIALTLAEVALRNADLKKADSLLKLVTEKNLILPYQAAFDYMRGEAARQKGDIAATEKIWKALKDGKDDLYRAKAGLALTTLQIERKEIKPFEAVDRLEGLRYAWRGDDLETSVNYKLGQMYLANNDALKGLALLRQAASLSPNSDQSKRINAEMATAFGAIFEPNKIKNINPVDAITVYNEFSSLVPQGPQGQKIVRQLADRLADADLLPRAAGLLEKQLTGGQLQGEEAATTAVHLASIYVQDTKPDKALVTLSQATSMLTSVSADAKISLERQIALLKAQALAEQKKPEEAFAVLAGQPQTQELLKLRADIAWKAQRWQDAADSFEGLVKVKDISSSRPASDEDADVLLSWGVALYLADNRFVLSNLRDKYSAAMATSPKANQFEVVTRPRQSSQLTDRDTINSIIEETDIFKGFVDSSRAANKAADEATAQPAAKTVEPVKEAVPPKAPISTQ